MSKIKEPSPFHTLLEKTSVGTIVPKDRSLISLKESQTVSQALKTLSDHKILAAPIFDTSNNLVSMVSTYDILTFLVAAVQSGRKSTEGEVKGSSIFSLKELTKIKKQADTTKLSAVTSTGQTPIVPYYGENPMSLLVELFATRPKLHRVALFTKDGQLVRPCSQTDAVRFFASHLEDSKEIKELLSKSVEDIVKENKRPVVKVPHDTPVVDCMHKMVGVDIHGLAVIDEEGKLISQFEYSSLRGVYESDFKTLSFTVHEFLTKSGAKKPHKVELKATAADLIQLFEKHKVHRFWVVDEKQEPTALVELTDILQLVATGERVTETQISGGITHLWFPFSDGDKGTT